jgi:hypothetical protein
MKIIVPADSPQLIDWPYDILIFFTSSSELKVAR